MKKYMTEKEYEEFTKKIDELKEIEMINDLINNTDFDFNKFKSELPDKLNDFKKEIFEHIKKNSREIINHLKNMNVINTPLSAFNRMKDYIYLLNYDFYFLKKKNESFKISTYMLNVIKNGVIFRPTEDVMNLLEQTDISENIKIKLPFDIIFIDYAFKIGQLKIDGISLLNMRTVDSYGEITPRIMIISTGVDTNDYSNFYIYDYINSIDTDLKKINNFNIIDRQEKYVELKIVTPIITKLAKNFIHLLNSQNYKMIVSETTKEQNDKRIKRGKSPIPTIRHISLDEETKLYYQNIRLSEHRGFSHKFWVRGHFRNLKSDRYENTKTLWIKPYIKGQGILIKKEYKVTK